MQRVRRGERVVDGVPVAVVVLDVEAGDAERGRVSDRPTELLVVDAGAHRFEQRVDNRVWVVFEEAPRERGDTCVVDPRAGGGGRGVSGGERGDGRVGERDEVVRVSPLGELLGTLRLRGLADERREHLAGRPWPRCSSASNALLVKSIVWPSSMNTWSVTAANIIASASGSRAGSTSVVSSVRSAASDERVSTNRAVPAGEPFDGYAVSRRADRPGTAARGRACRAPRTRARARARARGRPRRDGGAGSPSRSAP